MPFAFYFVLFFYYTIIIISIIHDDIYRHLDILDSTSSRFFPFSSVIIIFLVSLVRSFISENNEEKLIHEAVKCFCHNWWWIRSTFRYSSPSSKQFLRLENATKKVLFFRYNITSEQNKLLTNILADLITSSFETKQKEKEKKSAIFICFSLIQWIILRWNKEWG